MLIPNDGWFLSANCKYIIPAFSGVLKYLFLGFSIEATLYTHIFRYCFCSFLVLREIRRNRCPESCSIDVFIRGKCFHVKI